MENCIWSKKFINGFLLKISSLNLENYLFLTWTCHFLQKWHWNAVPSVKDTSDSYLRWMSRFEVILSIKWKSHNFQRIWMKCKSFILQDNSDLQKCLNLVLIKYQIIFSDFRIIWMSGSRGRTLIHVIWISSGVPSY